MWLKDVQSREKNQNIFKRRKTVAVSRRENAIIVILKNITQMNVESQENHNKLLKQKTN